MKVATIVSVCGLASPRLIDHPEIRFACQKDAGHKGQHRAVFAWDQTTLAEDHRPWKGTAESEEVEV